jgi:acetyl/propionyl-CoA carboxylase alpha subunit
MMNSDDLVEEQENNNGEWLVFHQDDLTINGHVEPRYAEDPLNNFYPP